MAPAGGVGVVAAAQAKQRRAVFLNALRQGGTVQKAAAAAGWALNARGGCPAYWQNRKRWKDFAAEADVILASPDYKQRVRAEVSPKSFEQLPPAPPGGENGTGEHSEPWDGNFASFREVFLGRSSPSFHVQAVNTIEGIITTGLRNAGFKPTDNVPANANVSFGGQVILLLWPPEHGKTALWEDADQYFLSRFPWFLITVGSEKETHSRKVVKFVRDRFSDDAIGMERLRERFGPFAPRKQRAGAAQQAWGATHFDVYKKPRGGSRDYSMAAIGMGASIVGTRCHLLQVDDPQSRKSLNLTDKLVEEFRQDWLSRPGVTGFTVILMNRVGEDDFPTKLQEQGLVDHVIKVPAWDEDRGWAWPERYSPADYARLRRNVGADAWDRNYMQIGTPARSMTFSDKHFVRARNPLRSILHPPPKKPNGDIAEVCIGVDPGYGTTSITAGAIEPTRLRILDCHAIRDLTAQNQMMRFLEDFLITYTVDGVSRVRSVVVETKAFQKGFITDDRFLELQAQYAFDVIPHLTGDEKTDDDIGITQMALSYLRGEIDLPDADEVSRDRLAPFYKEHKTWRPHVSGAKLRQDRVMSTWFVWMQWRRQRRFLTADASQFSFRGLPSR